MSMTLRDEDRRALDLLLDRTPAASNLKAGVVFTANDGVSNERVQGVERILRVLEALPAAEPPQDLVGRTLRRIEQTVEMGGVARRPVLIDAQRPVA